jgi:hypothetical protein
MTHVDRGNPRVRHRHRLRVALGAGSRRGSPGWLGCAVATPQSSRHDGSCGARNPRWVGVAGFK